VAANQAIVDAGLAGLSDEDRRLVESWLVEFDQSWTKDRMAAWVRKLPPLGNKLRRPALVEMVKIDLERRWEHGLHTRLEAYLKALPELGTPETVALDLILTEYEVREQIGAPVTLEEFAGRFPRKIEEVKHLLEQAREDGPGSRDAPPPQAALTPRPTALPPLTFPQAVSSEGPKELGRYRIVKRLGQGGMGSVYLAEDGTLNRKVALKIPHFGPDDGPDVLQRFYREARSAATIEHPNLCRVYDVGAIDGTHFLTMEYIEGEAMSELLKNGTPLSQRQIAVFVRKLALALQEAHSKGVIHRDLKPANIMINRQKNIPCMLFLRIGAAYENKRKAQNGKVGDGWVGHA